jgi:hypothetical protein
MIFVILAVFMCLCYTRDAYAYIDLGSGSYIFQFLMGILLGLLFAAKAYWLKIKSSFFVLFSKFKKGEKN